MRIELFRVFGWGVPTHEFFVALGVAVAGLIYLYEARRRGMLSEQTTWVAVGALIGGAILAKIGSAWRFVGDGNTITELYLYGGRTILGGLAGAYFGAVVTKRIVGVRFSTGDLFAPAVAIGLAVGRIGCSLTEQPGTATTLPWGVTVSEEAAAAIVNCPQCAGGTPMHPSFLYEILFLAGLFAVLWWRRDRWPVPGFGFRVFLLSYGVFRFGVEFVRGNSELALGLSGSQLFLLVTVPLLAVYVASVLGRREVPAEVDA